MVIRVEFRTLAAGHWPRGYGQRSAALLTIDLPSVALLDVSLGTEHMAARFLTGVPTAGKPTNERRLLAASDQLLGD
jgi:hypothetical protein